MDNTQGFLGAEPSEKKGGLFRKKEEIAIPQGPSNFEQISTIDRRLRILESRYTDLSRKIQVVDGNLLNHRKLVTKEIKAINLDILDIKKQMLDFKNKIGMIIGDLSSCTRKDELEALKKYIELWDPVNFVTRNEVEQIVDEKLEDRKENS